MFSRFDTVSQCATAVQKLHYSSAMNGYVVVTSRYDVKLHVAFMQPRPKPACLFSDACKIYQRNGLMLSAVRRSGSLEGRGGRDILVAWTYSRVGKEEGEIARNHDDW